MAAHEGVEGGEHVEGHQHGAPLEELAVVHALPCGQHVLQLPGEPDPGVVIHELTGGLSLRGGYVYKKQGDRYQVINTARPYSAYNIPITSQDPGQDGKGDFISQSGTLNGNPIAAVAGLATLAELRKPGAYEALHGTGRRLMAGAERRMSRTPPEAAYEMFLSMGDYSPADAARRLTVPLRAINGDLYPTDVAAVRKVVPDFDAIIMEHMGHYPMIERPDEFNRHVAEVVSALSNRGSSISSSRSMCRHTSAQ